MLSKLILLTVLFPNLLFAQTTWKKLIARFSFPACVEVNPLSKGMILYTTSGLATNQPVYLLRSDDAGASWTQHKIISRLGNVSVHQILCLPSDTSILFALCDSVFRSTDGGSSWTSVLPLATDDGQELIYHAASNTLFFSPSDSLDLWKSTDHGAHWSKTMTTAKKSMVCALAISPDLNGPLFAGEDQGGIERSFDGGATWLNSLDDDTSKTRPETATMFYVPGLPHTVMATCWSSRDRSILESTDDGTIWTMIASDSVYAWALEVDPDPAKFQNNRPLHFWAGLLGGSAAIPYDVGETTDGGNTWNYTTFPDQNNGVWVLKYIPETQTLIAASTDGIYALQTESGVRNNNSKEDKLEIVQNAAGISVHCPQNADQLAIYDLMGRLVLRIDRELPNVAIPINRLRPGCYFIRATHQDATVADAKFAIP
jgi:hypothetical protein